MPLIEWHCDWLVKCPLCGNCRAVADQKYLRCQKCIYSHSRCRHTEEQIAMMIKRDNFRVSFGSEGEQLLGELIRENLAKHKDGNH